MELFLLRHGIAKDAEPGQSDEERKLTSTGKEKLKEVLRLAAQCGVRPTLILSSPLVRAMQTAEIAAKELGYKGTIVQSDMLIPEADPRLTWEDIRLYKGEQQLLLSSHNPLCASLCPYLLGAPGLSVDFKKGGIMRIDFDALSQQPRGILKWYLTPKAGHGE
jgi:phosphohistidine phosphatase